MKARTQDELSTYLRDDLAWRRKENKVLRGIVQSSDAAKKQAVLRGAIACLYAHWEGFVKSACRVYLEYVRLRRLRHSELSIALLGLAFRVRLKATIDDNRIDSHRDFADWILREWDQRARLPDPDEIFSTSNLNSQVFKSFMLGLGLPYDNEFALAEKPVIDALVDARNHLAHGEWRHVEEEEYDELGVWIDKLMVRVCDNTEDAVVTAAYRRKLVHLS